MLEWLEASSVAVWVGTSPSVWAHPTVLTVHTAGMGILVGASWMLDLRLLGINRHIPLSAFRWVFPAIALGLAMNLATGVLLFMKNATTWGTSIPFFVKMTLVVVAVGTLAPLRSRVLRDADPGPARALAIVSLLAWAGAVTAGRLLAYLAV